MSSPPRAGGETTTPPTSPADLTAEIIAPSNLDAGDTFTVELTVSNQSSNYYTSNNSQALIFLSKDQNMDSNDKALKWIDLDSIPAGGQLTFSEDSLTLPDANDSYWTGNGIYYVGVMVDPSETTIESDRSNNLNFSSVSINTGIDPIFDDLNVDYDLDRIYFLVQNDRTGLIEETIVGGDIFPGSTVPIRVRVENEGNDVAPETDVSIYLSYDDELDFENDLLLKTVPFPRIAPDGENERDYDITLPEQNDFFWIGEGTYNIIGLVNPFNQIIETPSHIMRSPRENNVVHPVVNASFKMKEVDKVFTAPGSTGGGIDNPTTPGGLPGGIPGSSTLPEMPIPGLCSGNLPCDI